MTASRIARDPGFEGLKDRLVAETGLAYYRDNEDQLATIVARRLAVHGFSSIEPYGRLIASVQGREEFDTLLAELTIGETYFFRHPEVFQALRDTILPPLLAVPGRPLRIWSAGCSIGAEPYTLSILLRRELGLAARAREITILGTDIDAEALRKARRGLFGEWALRGLSNELRQAVFARRGRLYELRPEYREGVRFQRHNLVRDAAPAMPGGFDVILCRNVMIYFESAVTRELVARFHSALAPDGWFFPGAADLVAVGRTSFRPVRLPQAIAYRRAPELESIAGVANPAASRPAARARAAAPVPAASPSPRRVPVAARAEDTDLTGWFDRAEWARVLEHCDARLATDELDARAYFFRALALEQTGDAAAAERDLRRSVYVDRRHVGANFHLGRLLWQNNRRGRAARFFRAVANLIRGTDGDVAVPDTDLTVGELRMLLVARGQEASDG